jgi:hypothetical protein
VWRDNPELILVCVSLPSNSGLDKHRGDLASRYRSQALLISHHRFDSDDDRIQAVRKSLNALVVSPFREPSGGGACREIDSSVAGPSQNCQIVACICVCVAATPAQRPSLSFPTFPFPDKLHFSFPPSFNFPPSQLNLTPELPQCNLYANILNRTRQPQPRSQTLVQLPQ